MAKLDENYNGLTRLREFWPKVKANFSVINKQLVDHIAGTADRHKAEDVDYSGAIADAENVKEAVEAAHRLAMEAEESLLNHQTAEVLDHPDGSVTDKHIGSRTIQDPRVDDGTCSGTLTTLFNRVATAVRALRANKVDKEDGKGLSSNDYTDEEKEKLAGIESGATSYTHPTGDGYLHVPATGTTNAGKVLMAGATPGSLSWQTVQSGGPTEQIVAVAQRLDIVIPSAGWRAVVEETEPLHVEIALDDVTEDMTPIVSILPAYLDTARVCGLRTACQTITGGLRFYADTAPTADILASLALLHALPTATETRLGGVKIGENVNVAEDGTISVDEAHLSDESVATDAEVAEMLGDVLGGQE